MTNSIKDQLCDVEGMQIMVEITKNGYKIKMYDSHSNVKSYTDYF